VLVSWGGVTSGVGVATAFLLPSYRRILGGAAGIMGVLLLLLVV
jgi:hypothetical protein